MSNADAQVLAILEAEKKKRQQESESVGQAPQPMTAADQEVLDILARERSDDPADYVAKKEGTFLGSRAEEARMLLDAQMRGWADEATAVVAAGFAALTTDKTYEEAYDESITLLEQQRKEIAEERPMMTLGTTIAGSILTPGSQLKAVEGLTKGAQAVVKGSQIVGEGAIAGAGFADQDRKEEGAMTGAAFSVAGSAAFKGLGWTFNKATQRKVTQDLGKGDDFVPITLADDSAEGGETMLGSFYRDLVGNSWGGRGSIIKQEDKIINPVASRQKRVGQDLVKAEANVKEAVGRINTTAKEAVEKVRERVADKKKAMTDATQDQKEALVREGKNAVERAKTKAVDDVAKAVDESEELFRAQAVLSAIPELGPKFASLADEIITAASPQQALQRLNNVWKEHGFSMIKGRKFQLKPQGIAQQIQKKIDEELGITLVGSNTVKNISDDISLFIQERTKKGWIDGEDLSDLRSKLGSMAGKIKGDDFDSMARVVAFKELQDIFNKQIRRQLSGPALKQFDDHVAKWPNTMILRDAITASSRKAGKEGRFTPDQWLSGVAKINPRALSEGRGALQKEADKVVNQGKMRDQLIQKRADEVTESILQGEKQAIKQAQRKLEQDIIKERKQAAIDIKQARTKAEAQARRTQSQSRVFELGQQKKQLDSQMQTLTKSAVARDGTIFQRLAAAGTMAWLFAGANAFTAGLLSRGFSSQTGQRLMAGQTGLQKALDPATEALNRASAQAGARFAGALAQPLGDPLKRSFEQY